MSKQLAVSAAFSVFAMAALALTAPHLPAGPETTIGATSELAAPTFDIALPAS